MKKKSLIGLVATVVGLSVVCIAFATGTFMLHGKTKRQQQSLDNTYKMNVYSLQDSAAAIENNLSMLLISADKHESDMLAADTLRRSECALCALQSLPVDYHDAGDAVRFLNQLSDFCYCYVNADECAAPNAQLDAMYQNCVLFNQSAQELHHDKPVRSGQSFAGITEVDDNQKKYAKIMYDGAFSDDAEPPCFKGLEHYEKISAEEAAKKAAECFEFVSLRGLTLVGTSESPAVYSFSGNTKYGQALISMSQRGGLPITVTLSGVKSDNFIADNYENNLAENLDENLSENLGDNYNGSNGKDREYLQNKAASYAKNCGYDALIPIEYTENGDNVFVSLAPKTDGVICYPDLVRVELTKDGLFVGLESTGYCCCCCKRELSPKITIEKAREAVSKKLTVGDGRLALIKKNNKEALTYEFEASYNGNNYKVYIDAQEGKQALIKRI